MFCTGVFSERMEKGKSDNHTQIRQDQTPLGKRIPGHQSVVNSRKMPRKVSDREAQLLPRDNWSNTITAIQIHCWQFHSGFHKDRLRIRWAQPKTCTKVMPLGTRHSGGVRHRLAPKNSSPSLETKMSPKHLQHGEGLFKRSHGPRYIRELFQLQTRH